MRLILTQDVPNLGGPGDVVEVADGYGRNYLVPRKLAMLASRGAEKQVTAIRRARQVRTVRDRAHADEVAAQLSQLVVRLPARAGASGRLFGSVTATDVVSAVLAAGGPTLDKRRLELPSHIKTTGTYGLAVRLHPEVTAAVTLEVVAAS